MTTERVEEVKIKSIVEQLAEVAERLVALAGPMTAEQWDRLWVDTRGAFREEGESEESAAVLADHLMLEHFGPRP